MKKVRLVDIAKLSGCSITQVSRALNNYPDVGYATRELVKETARKLGYVTNKTVNREITYEKKITVINMNYKTNHQIKGMISANTVAGIYQYAKENKLSMNVHYVSREEQEKYSFDEYASKHNISNCIVVGIDEKDPFFAQIEKTSVNVVLIDNSVSNSYYVASDDIMDMYRLVQEMLKEGYKKFLFVGGRPDIFISNQRELGFNRAIINAGLNISDMSYTYANFKENTAREQINEIINKNEFDFDAIVAVSDLMAIGVIKALNENGISVPKDCAVTGFDGLIIGEYFTPKLTTVRQNFFKKGYFASFTCARLMQKMDAENIVIESEIIWGKSIKE
jgi:LacI family transcriptional regulator